MIFRKSKPKLPQVYLVNMATLLNLLITGVLLGSSATILVLDFVKGRM